MHWYFEIHAEFWTKTCIQNTTWKIQHGWEYNFVIVFKRVRKISGSDYWLRHFCPTVRPHGITRLPPDGFSRNFIFRIFKKNQGGLKSVKSNGYFTLNDVNLR